jgi:flavin-dependent dehydrogenase
MHLDAILVAEAVRSGAVVRQCAVGDVVPQCDGTVLVTGRDPRAAVKARIVLLATGADVSLAARLGLVTRQRASAIALRCYVKSAARVSDLAISFDRAIIPGYAWIFPVGGGEYNVGCGSVAGYTNQRANLRRMLDAFLRHFPLARELMRDALSVTPPHGAMLRSGLRGIRLRPAAHVLVVGEAAGSTLPLTGEGIGKAMETAAFAAEATDVALRRGDPAALDSYERRLTEDLTPRYRAYERAERWLSVAWLNDFVAARVARSPALHRAAVGILNETADPRDVCSIPGVLRSFLSRQ